MGCFLKVEIIFEIAEYLVWMNGAGVQRTDMIIMILQVGY